MQHHHPVHPGAGRHSVYITLAAIAMAAILAALSVGTAAPLFDILFLLSQIVLISIVIWQACDPFADAAQWLGTTLRIPGSVRGATLDAVASSMPELFTGIFFVIVAMTAAGDGSREAMTQAGAEGYGATVATCAGSAIYNMILIPAFCAIFISYARPDRPTIDVEEKVITRDGLWFIGCEIVLIIFLFQPELHWWMAIVFMGLYSVYILQLYFDAKAYRRARDVVHDQLSGTQSEITIEHVQDALLAAGLATSPGLVAEVRRKLRDGPSDDGEEEISSAGLVYGLFDIPLNHFSAWAIILASTLVAAIACYWLVEVIRATASQLGVPIFFVAVILAAAASSVPDTFLSIGATRRGDNDGAVSNAFGSNIFDICVCLSIPLLVNSYLNGWQPVSLLHNGEPIKGLTGMRVLLCVLTLITLAIMWHNRQLTRRKAYVLCALYGIFIAYAVAGSIGIEGL